MKYKIMIIEDDPDIAELVSLHLEKFCFSVQCCKDFSNVQGEFEKAEPHLVLLDINLPSYDGFYWCGKLREKSSCPIIFLSSREVQSELGKGSTFTICLGNQNQSEGGTKNVSAY